MNSNIQIFNSKFDRKIEENARTKSMRVKNTKIQLRKLNSGADYRECLNGFSKKQVRKILNRVNYENWFLTLVELVELLRGRVPEQGRVPR